MSVVTVQLGQCGNQIGGQFFSTIVNDINSDSDAASTTKRQRQEYAEISTERFFSQDVSSSGEMGKMKAR